MSASVIVENFKRIHLRLRVILQAAWEVDARLLSLYYLTAAAGSLITLILYFTFAALIDALQGLESAKQSIVLIFGLVGLRYLLGALKNWWYFTLHTNYYDYLLRNKVQRELMRRYFTKFSNLDVEHLENAAVHTLAARCYETLPWAVTDNIRLLAYLLVPVIDMVLASIVLFSFGWWFPIVIVAIGLPRLYVRVKYGKFLWSMYGSGGDQLKKIWYYQGLLQGFDTIKELRIFGSTREITRKYEKLQDDIYSRYVKLFNQYRARIWFPIILEAVVLASIAFMQTDRALAAEISVGRFILCLGMLETLSGSISGIGMNLGQIMEQSKYLDQYLEFMGLPKRIEDKPSAIELNLTAPPSIEFRNVEFDYGTDKPILKNLSFKIDPGQRIALVGVNGAGKSTIVKLLCRFYDVKAGAIFLNGIDIRDIRLESWHSKIGTLFQNFVQFHFTVRECIQLGNPARIDEVAMQNAAKLAGADRFIQEFPKGYDQLLGREFDSGEELSMGQWQKLAIARVIYQDAPVIIMDEPTSAVDAEAEYEIFKNLDEVCRDKTLIFVSHRFSTVRNADKIFVIGDGEIIEQGSHSELLALNRRYASMFRTQAAGYIE